MLTGLNSGTAQNLQLGAGAVLKEKYVRGTKLTDENILTATNGGITFSAVPQFWTPSIDGAGEYVKDLRMVGNWVVTLTFTAVEADASVLLKALGCADIENGVIKGRHTINAYDYADLYVIGEKANGDVIQITIKNALSTNGLSLTTQNNGNGGIAFTINGHYDLDDLDNPPFEIENISSDESLTTIIAGSYDSGTQTWTDGGVTFETLKNGDTVKVTGTLPYEPADATLGLPAGNRLSVKIKNSAINSQSDLPSGIIAKVSNSLVDGGYNTYDKTAFEADGSMISVVNIVNKNKPLVIKITWTEGKETVYTFDVTNVTLAQA